MHVSVTMRDTVGFQLENRLLRLLILLCRPTHSMLRLHSAKKAYPLSIQLVLGVKSSLNISHFKQLLNTFINSFLQLHKILGFVVNVTNFLIHFSELGPHILKASVFLRDLPIDFKIIKLIHLVALLLELDVVIFKLVPEIRFVLSEQQLIILDLFEQ